MVDIRLEFPHSYEIDEAPELPATGGSGLPIHYFPRAKARPEHDGIWILVRPATGQPWIGVFGFGGTAISRVVSIPDADRFCVISKGTAYVLKANEPERWEKLDAMPVRDVRAILDQQLVVFASFDRLIAYGNNKIVWKSPHLCGDDLRILNIDGDSMKCVGYEPSDGCDSRFTVDLHSGQPVPSVPASSGNKTLRQCLKQIVSKR